MQQEMIYRLMSDAGVRGGMRVFDIRCGRGDVATLAAQLVGTQGQVVGVDKDENAIEMARARMRELGLTNVSFALADLGTLPGDLGRFNAVVGRRVLMYQPDAVECLGAWATCWCRVGSSCSRSTIPQRCRSAVRRCRCTSASAGGFGRRWRARGADVQMGLHLASALARAGLVVERVRAEATVLTPHQSHAIGTIVRAMLGRMAAAGVATPDEIDVDTLDARLAAERQETNGTCVWELVFGAWARRAA